MADPWPKLISEMAAATLNPADSEANKPEQIRTMRELKRLHFCRPGPKMSLQPETERRTTDPKVPGLKTGEITLLADEDRKVWLVKAQKWSQYYNGRIYDEGGLAICSGRDLCDCMSDVCPGCFKPCQQCNSKKCGVECRRNRKWAYSGEQVVGIWTTTSS